MNIYLPAGKDKANFFARGVCGWFKTNLNKKVGGEGKLLFFSCNFCLDYFFIKWEGKAGSRGGLIQAN